MDDIESMDHTERFGNVINQVYQNNTIEVIALRLQHALYAEHDIVIRLHERLLMARGLIAYLEEARRNDVLSTLPDGDA